MRLISAELLKLRRRWATYIVLAVLLALMGLVYFFLGQSGAGAALTVRFPSAYEPINNFVFGLGSLLAVAYAAAVAGADWSWGIFGTVVARGESRTRYVLAKSIGLAIVLLLGVLLAYAAGIAMTYAAAAMAGASVGQPFGSGAIGDLARSVGYGYVVLLERAAIGFMVAVVLRSQMAGVIVGIVLYIGETILIGILTFAGIAGQIEDGSGGFPDIPVRGPEWFQHLPFSIGDGVMARAVSGQSLIDQGPGDILLRPVTFEAAFLGTLVYLVVAVAIALAFVRRAQLVGSSG